MLPQLLAQTLGLRFSILLLRGVISRDGSRASRPERRKVACRKIMQGHTVNAAAAAAMATIKNTCVLNTKQNA
jgi:hypothetical protein